MTSNARIRAERQAQLYAEERDAAAQASAVVVPMWLARQRLRGVKSSVQSNYVDGPEARA